MLNAGGLVTGGWNAATNIVNTIGKGASSLIGSFFPTQQKTTIKSETVQAAGGSGMTYRPVRQDAPSLIESNYWATSLWEGSPYAAQYAPTTKVQESQALAQTVGVKSDPISEGLDWALSQTKKVVTLWDEIQNLFGKKREVINETPRAGTKEGEAVQHVNDAIKKGVGIIEQGTAWVEKIWGQVKGLFNVGFPGGNQPAFTIAHEIQPSTKTTVYLAIAAAVIVLLILLKKKK